MRFWKNRRNRDTDRITPRDDLQKEYESYAKTWRQIKLKPIGVVHTRATPDEIRNGSGRAEAVVEICEGFEEALYGLDGFSHIFVLGYFHQLRHEQIGPLKVKTQGPPETRSHAGGAADDWSTCA